MLNNFINILSFNGLPLAILGVVFFIFSFFWSKLFVIFNLNRYEGVQRVHEDEIFRLSGFVIYIFFAVLYFFRFFDYNLVVNILIASIPIVIFGLKEDLIHNTSPRSRLISMIISILIFFYINPTTFPVLDIPLLGAVINFYPISIIFFTFSVLVVMNGMNLIDGMNGLFGFTALFILLAISIIAFRVGDFYIMEIAILFTAPLIIFLLFNFPFGKVFIGDLGAYFYGFVIAVLTISLFGKHNYLLTWFAILILFYPCMELLFSFIRKIKNHKNPFGPDSYHLHTIIYKQIKITCKNSLSANALTTISIFYFWLAPFLISLIFPISFLLTIGLILLLLFFYISIFQLINDKFQR